MTENNRTSHAEPKSSPHCAAFGAAQGRLAEEPQDVRLSGRGVARDRGGAFQLHGQENARAAGRRERATTATHVAGQHRQQRAGLEEPGAGRTAKRAAGSNGRRCRARSGACVCDARATGCRRGLWPKRRGIHFVRSRPALRASAARRHAAATYSCAATSAAHCRERARTG